MKYNDISGGTGQKLTKAIIIVAGVASLAASILSFVSIWLQTKNYRKPLLQRYVVRILLMVPIYSAASWTSIMSLKAAFFVDAVRDIYEAFTIYTFFQLLINFLGGERALIIMMHGRPPVNHLWPLSHCLPKVDISDPHTFLAIKRGILQYAWLKPILSFAAIIMKATGTYKEGYIGLSSGYFWSGILYNISVTLSLYSLGMFWVCMSHDLQPFRPVPKFLCIKLIIFASYWQGFFLSIIVFLGAFPDKDVTGYTPDNIAAAIQDALICFEMPAFAIAHWYAFSWHDYADITISAARMPVLYAVRDAFGVVDLIQDTKETFGGGNYEYRLFDTGDNVLAHEESGSRVKRMMEGMRYERGGKGKYWIPKPGEPNSHTPLLAEAGASRTRDTSPTDPSNRWNYSGRSSDDVESVEIDQDDERLYENARSLEFGDWNYPVITAHEASRERWMNHEPSIITTSTNRNLLQPTVDGKARRESDIRKTLDKGKHRGSSGSREGSKTRSRAPAAASLLRNETSSSNSAKSSRSQLIDLVVEDTAAEDKERVRARKEGGAEWNEEEPRQYVRVYPDADEGEEIRTGFEPSSAPLEDANDTHRSDPSGVSVDAHQDEPVVPASGQSDGADERHRRNVGYGGMDEERNVWDYER